MTERQSRQTALLGRLEAAYGTPETVFDQYDAVLCSGMPEITFESDNVKRNLTLPWPGASEEIPGRQRARIKFTTELVGSGTKGTPPAWGKWLRACGFSETIVAGTSVTYTVAQSPHAGLTTRFYKAGVRYLAPGTRGNVEITLDAAGIPRLSFEMLGFGVTPLAQNIPAIDLTAFIDPQLINTENSGHFWLGASMNALGVFTAGTMVPMQSMSVKSNGSLVHRTTVDDERIIIKGREVTGRIQIDQDAAAEIAAWTAYRAATSTSIGFRHGSADGRYVSIYAPKAQRVSPQHVDQDGFLMQSYDVRCVPGMTGTPELTIVCA